MARSRAVPNRRCLMAASLGSVPRSGHAALGQYLPCRKLADFVRAAVNRFMRNITGGGTALVKETDRLRGKSISEGGRRRVRKR